MITRVLFVCHGNICRSTMAHFVFQYMVNRLNLADLFDIDSRGTSTEELGNPPHRGTVNKLKAEGVPVLPHRATQISKEDYESFEHIIAMDENNVRNLRRMLKTEENGKIHKLLFFAGTDRDIADPWYTGDFDATYRDVVAGCEGFLEYLKKEGRL